MRSQRITRLHNKVITATVMLLSTFYQSRIPAVSSAVSLSWTESNITNATNELLNLSNETFESVDVDHALPSLEMKEKTLLRYSPALPAKITTQTTSYHNPSIDAGSIRNITFYVMGDVPYSEREAKKLSEQVDAIPADAEFVYHVGDIMKSEDGCNETFYTDVKDRLLESEAPVFITPGDNDWNNCANPDRSWMYWTRHFIEYDLNWDHQFDVSRQPNRQENISFFYNHVLFIGVNIVGEPVLDEEEWNSRLNDDYDFTKTKIEEYEDKLSSVVIFGHARPQNIHNRFFSPLAFTVMMLKKPVVYIHGDGHEYYFENEMQGIKNLMRVQVDRGGKAAPLKVVVTGDSDAPFHFYRVY